MNYALVFKLHAIILWALAGVLGLSLGVSFAYGDGGRFGLGLSLVATLALAVFFSLIGQTDQRRLHRKEAVAVVGSGWILAGLVGALPYLLIVPHIGVAGAIFESVSGFTTTGASVLTGLEELPRGLLFWRAMTQWIGGLGVVVFFVAILSFLGAGSKVLYSREASGQVEQLDTARIQQAVARLMWLYLGLSATCTVVFFFCGLDLYEAFTHMAATVSTGGFSTRSASLAAFENPALEWSAILFMALGGTSFILLIRLLRGEWKAWRGSSEVHAYLLIIGLSGLAIAGFLWWGRGEEPLEALRDSLFQVVSIMTTTGFATEDFNLWPPVAQMILLALMAVGGCTGSTAGGIKVLRFVVGWRIMQQQIERAYRSRVVRALRVNGMPLDRDDQEEVTVFFTLFAILTLASMVLLSLLEPNLSVVGSISAVAASICNVGPGLAEVGPVEVYAPLGSPALILLSFLMILGRVELFAVLALFSRQIWRRF